MSGMKYRLQSVLLCLCCMFLFTAAMLPLRASAAADKTLTLVCRKEKQETLAGMEWRLYRVGERRGDAFVLTGDFEDYPIDFGTWTAEDFAAAAEALKGRAVSAHFEPVDSGKTDQYGEYTVSGLSAGLYLAVGSMYVKDSIYYISSPLMLELREDQEDASFNAYPKLRYGVKDNGNTKLAVRKVWEADEENAVDRPVSITVDLFRDDELYDTVVLDERCNWVHYWQDLDDMADWIIVEREIPVNYRVSIESNTYQFIIKNSYVPPSVTTVTTETGTAETITTTTTATATDETGTTTGTGTNDTAVRTTRTATATTTITVTDTGGKIPQTGQLWWPVLPLSIGGIACIACGLMLRPKRNEDEE